MTESGLFHFRGRIPASKSILNRLLILKSFSPPLMIKGDSNADDVVRMKSALSHLERGEVADCGSAGTTLRFLALRASRIPGTHHLAGALRLFERPQGEIVRMLKQLGCEADLGPQRLTIRGQGWKIPDEGIVIDRSVSSQFVSAVVLSAWDLPKPLKLRMEGEAVSESYFAMTLELARRAGLEFAASGGELTIRPGCRIRAQEMEAEIDLSSAFAVAALAAVAGEAEIEGWPQMSLQPDAVFAGILRAMGCTVNERSDGSERTLRIARPAGPLKAIEWNLRESPDLFPVLATLCASAEGRSRLYGAPHLAHKESSRIEKTAELIHMMGRRTHAIDGGLEIEGSARAPQLPDGKTHRYDTDHDHRLAMAAAVARATGAPIEILHPEVVTKSFPEFWEIAQGGR